jgi:hypothetical protein
MKMPKKSSTATNNQQSVLQDPQPNRCHFETSDGRRCRMLRNGHPTLCLFHARDELQILESQRLGSELSASLTGRFMTATDINFVLGNLFAATAQNRIPPRNAAVLAYIGQIMLHSLPSLKDEFRFEYKFKDWKDMLGEATYLSNSAIDPHVAPPPSPGSATDSVVPRNPPIVINSTPNSVSSSHANQNPAQNSATATDPNSSHENS